MCHDWSQISHCKTACPIKLLQAPTRAAECTGQPLQDLLVRPTWQPTSLPLSVSQSPSYLGKRCHTLIQCHDSSDPGNFLDKILLLRKYYLYPSSMIQTVKVNESVPSSKDHLPVGHGPYSVTVLPTDGVWMFQNGIHPIHSIEYAEASLWRSPLVASCLYCAI